LSASVPPALRRAQILERIRRQGGVSIADLAENHGVSTITVHRDLAELAADGLIERVHGGARALDEPAGARIETAWERRVAQARDAKAAMAAHAARLVEENATVFLDSSSTCLALARRLEADPPVTLTLVTNSPAIAFELAAESIHVIVTPGEVDQHMRLIGGRWAYEFLSELNIDLAFISAAGITLEQGLTTSRRPLADVVNAARAVSRRCVALIDSSKFGRASLLSLARPDELDLLIVDPGLSAEIVDEYRTAGVPIEVAGPCPRGRARPAPEGSVQTN
jgi:DeoR/GlpR family transcriptional regulator of sugar metabolism